ncbi:MAG: flavonol synthase, partial [Caulobacterales bacterium 32-67-6]
MTSDAIIPVSFDDYEADFGGFAQALGDSFTRYGFAVIGDHPLAQPGIEGALAAAKAFFALPEAEKRAYVVGQGGQRGYTPFGVETAKGETHHDLKE